MAITTMTQLPPEVRTYFDRMLLTLARPYFIYDLFAQKRQIPLNSGDQMVFARYGTLSAATIPLTDGQTPAGSQLSRTDFKAAISWYGDYVTIKNNLSRSSHSNKPSLIEVESLWADTAQAKAA